MVHLQNREADDKQTMCGIFTRLTLRTFGVPNNLLVGPARRIMLAESQGGSIDWGYNNVLGAVACESDAALPRRRSLEEMTEMPEMTELTPLPRGDDGGAPPPPQQTPSLLQTSGCH